MDISELQRSMSDPGDRWRSTRSKLKRWLFSDAAKDQVVAKKCRIRDSQMAEYFCLRAGFFLIVAKPEHARIHTVVIRSGLNLGIA
jgi:hypothetical protein